MRSLLFGGGFTSIRKSSAIGCVHVYRERLSALSAQEALWLEAVAIRFRKTLISN